jgi:predicted dehydrogenase
VSIDRILIVGLGSIGQRHLRLARQLHPNADIRILRHQAGSPVPDAANGVFSRIEDACAFSPQVAAIASPASCHIATAQELANTGTHLLIEKPLSDSLDGVRSLLQTCRERGTVLMTGYNLRFLPSLRRFRELLSEAVIGRVLSIRCEVGQYLPGWRPDFDYRLGVSARRELGGGAVLELSHELDYLRWIFGDVDWVKATVCRQSRLEIDVEDSAHLILGFTPNTDGSQLVGTVNMDFIRHDSTRLCTAIGESGSLCWNGVTGNVSLYVAGAKEWRNLFSHQPQRDESYLAEWRNFIDCVNEHTAPAITGEDGLKVLEIIEAIRASASSGDQVSILTMKQVTKAHS